MELLLRVFQGSEQFTVKSAVLKLKTVVTCIPDTVKYGISNLMWMGGLPSRSSVSTLGRPKWARIKYSFPPYKTHRHIINYFINYPTG